MNDRPSGITATELHLIRTSHGLTAADLALFLGVGLRTIRRWEAGGNIPDGVSAEIRSLDDIIDRISDSIRADFTQAQATGAWSVDVPTRQAEIDDPRIPLSLWEAGAARAAERHGVRLTVSRGRQA